MVPPKNHTSRLINHYSCHLGQLIHRIQNPVTINLILIVHCFQKKNQTITVTESVPFQSSISWNNKKAFPVICSGFVWGCKLCLYDPPQIICDSLTQPVYNGAKAKFRLKDIFRAGNQRILRQKPLIWKPGNLIWVYVNPQLKLHLPALWFCNTNVYTAEIQIQIQMPCTMHRYKCNNANTIQIQPSR